MSDSADLDPQVRELLTVLRDLLDVPMSQNYEDREAWRDLLHTRRIHAVSAVDAVLEGGSPLESAIRVARRHLASSPVDYTPRRAG